MNKFQEILVGVGLMLFCIFGTAVDGPNWVVPTLIVFLGIMLMGLAVLIEFIKERIKVK